MYKWKKERVKIENQTMSLKKRVVKVMCLSYIHDMYPKSNFTK